MKNKKFIIPVIACASLISSSALTLTSCSSNNTIVFANFSGYMRPEVQSELKKDYNIQYDEYESNETIPIFLKNGTYDIAVTTQYKTVELARESYKYLFDNSKKANSIISPIDWSKFGLKDSNGEDLVVKKGQLFDFKNIKKYFTDQVWSMLTAYDLDGNDTFDEFCNDNLLNWTIPYFAQTLSFGYRGEKIEELHKPNILFKDIFNYFQSEQSLTTIFKDKKPLSLIKDERTDYDLSMMLQDKSIFINNDYKISTIEKLTEDYETLDNAIVNSKTNIDLEGDSNTILNQLALNETCGAITYNGDLIYSSFGGDYSDELEKRDELPNEQNFHVVTPSDTLVCFDGIIISNKIANKNLDNVYDIIKKISFITENNVLIDSPQKIIELYLSLSSKYNLDGENSEALNCNLIENNSINDLPLLNFDYVFYNPVWKSILDAILEDENNDIVDDWQKPFFSQNSLIMSNEVVHNNNKPDGLYKNLEYPTNQIVNSNLNIANITFINRTVKKGD